MSKNYIVTNVDHRLWRDFKAACAYYDISIRATFLKHIENTVNDYRVARMSFRKPEPHLKKRGRK